MCSTCGCAPGERRIEGETHRHDDHHHAHGDHDHHHGHHHHSSHEHPVDAGTTVVVHHHHYYYGEVHQHYHGAYSSNRDERAIASHSFQPIIQGEDLHYGQDIAGAHAPGISQKRMLQIEMDVLSKNNHLAEHNRQWFTQHNILALNLVSSPGSGKTTLLTETLYRLQGRIACSVIEGDQQTTNDAERIRATGTPAIQVNTGKGCHLDAQMISDAIAVLKPSDNSVVFIENVGNLVCPASFDLGERSKIAVLSVTEGEDKPLKYPHLFAAAQLLVINKIDLLPYVKFDVAECIKHAKRINPAITVIQLSATTGEGMDEWLNWLENSLCV